MKKLRYIIAPIAVLAFLSITIGFAPQKAEANSQSRLSLPNTTYFAQATAPPGTPATGTPPPAPPADSEDTSCSKAGKLSWILCPTVKALSASTNWLDTQIQALLEVDESTFNNPSIYNAWRQIRNIAYIILLPIMLVMVIATAMGSEFFSAYTVKKALPRMGAAILFITLSFFICTFLISFSNVVGKGALGIITSPFNELVTKSGSTKTVADSGLTDLFHTEGGNSDLLSYVLLPGKIVAFAAALMGIIVFLCFFYGTILLLVGIAFLILLLRQVFVIALLLVAPLAILAWIFPGNDKLWKAWWSIFSKLLIMFPLIMAIIAVGRSMAWVVDQGAAGDGGLQGAFIKPVAKVALYMLPYAFIPFTFKFAGGAFATIAGMANDKSKGVFDRQRKGRAAKAERWRSGNAFKSKDGIRGGLNSAIGYGMNAKKSGFSRAKMSTYRDDMQAIEAHKAGEDPANAQTLQYDNLDKAALEASVEGSGKAGIRKALLRQEDDRKQKKELARENAQRKLLKENPAATAGELEAAGNAAADNVKLRYTNPLDLDRDVARTDRLMKSMSKGALQKIAGQKMVGGGTANSGGGEALRMMAMTAQGGAGEMDAVAKFRKESSAAGKVMWGGGGQGDVYEIMRKIKYENMSDEDADLALGKAAYKTQGANVVAHPSMKGSDIDMVVRIQNAQIDDAIESGDIDAIDTQYAFAKNLLAVAQTSSPQHAEKITKGVMMRQVSTAPLVETDSRTGSNLVSQLDLVQEVEVTPATERLVLNEQTKVFEKQAVPAVVERRVAPTMNVMEAASARSTKSELYNALTRDFGDQMRSQRANAAAADAAARGGGPPPPGAAAGGPPPGARPSL